MHASKDEFVQQLSHNYVAYYDNVRGTPKWLADEACKAVTGIGQTKRKLYTNDEDVVYEYKRCLGFSGINICMTEPDVLDRSILIELRRIPRDKSAVKTTLKNSPLEILEVLEIFYIFLSLNQNMKIRCRRHQSITAITAPSLRQTYKRTMRSMLYLLILKSPVILLKQTWKRSG
jgi:hypothetical protein